MKNVLKSKTFWLVFAVAAVAIFLLFLNVGQTYRSETDILIIPKSELAVKNSEQIVENLSQLPLTLSFYQKMISDNQGVAKSTVLELPSYNQKAYWNSKLKIERVGMSGEIKLVASDKDSYYAETLSSQAVKTLINTVGIYYDIQNDLDIRIIEPVITRKINGTFNYAQFAESLLGVFALLFLLFSFFGTVFEKIEMPSFTRPRFSFPYSNKKHLSGKATANIPLEKTVVASEKDWTTAEKPYTDFSKNNKTASAPANLPIAKDDLVEKESVVAPTKKVTSSAVSVSEKIAPINKEATAEEVKERLNKLLSGKL